MDEYRNPRGQQFDRDDGGEGTCGREEGDDLKESLRWKGRIFHGGKRNKKKINRLDGKCKKKLFAWGTVRRLGGCTEKQSKKKRAQEGGDGGLW